MIERHYLEDVLLQLRKLRALADAALAQLPPEGLFATIDPDSNSIAVIMKHMAGNMRSRWSDFLVSDGEKPDRARDLEFVIESEDDAARIQEMWEEGWALVLETVSALTPEDLARTVRIRGEAHTVLEAISRQTTHYAAHVGQIVLLARHFAGPGWRSLSIPRGESTTFDVSKGGRAFRI